MSDFRNYLNEQFKNDEFKAGYEKITAEIQITLSATDNEESINIASKNKPVVRK